MKNNNITPLEIVSALHKASRQMSIYLGACMEGFPVKPNEGHLLSYLSIYGPCAVNELIGVFGYKNTTMTSILGRLVDGGYIKREVNPDDRRSFLISTSAKGTKMGQRARLFAEDFDKAVLARLTKNDMAGFKKILKAIAEETKVEVRKIK